jgi:biotin carboxyl carrier protein
VIVPPEQQTLDLELPARRSPLAGETLTVPERMIVAPVVGIFRPNEVGEGVELQAGDEIGVVEGPGTSCPVRSPFDGTLMGMLAHPGERLRSGQPIAWLRVA